MRENCHGDGEQHCCCELPEDCTEPDHKCDWEHRGAPGFVCKVCGASVIPYAGGDSE
jgi:hypothetical protein